MANGLGRPHVLFVDAYDSFSENVGALISKVIVADIDFVKIDADASNPAALEAYIRAFDAIIIGPGPGNPSKPPDIGIIPLLLSVAETNTIPVLGVCLGFQILCLSFGVSVIPMPIPCHGLTKRIRHSSRDIFSGIGDVLATNYNSLGVRVSEFTDPPSRPSSVHSLASDSAESNSDSSLAEHRSHDLEQLAWDDFGWTMAVRHKRLPLWGLQFHPESCKSSLSCQEIVKIWWNHCLAWNSTHRQPTSHMLPIPKAFSSTSRRIPVDTSVCQRANTSKTESQSLSTLKDICPSNTLSPIQTHLHLLSASSGPTVYTATTKLSSTDAIAELCRREAPSWTTMLESTKKGRYSIYAIPSPSNWRVELFSQKILVSSQSAPAITFSIPDCGIFTLLKSILRARKATGGDAKIPFWGGFLGFFSYELGLNAAEFVPAYPSQSDRTPHASLAWVERSIVVDHLEGRVYVQSVRRKDSNWVNQFVNRVATLQQDYATINPEEEKFDKFLESGHFRLPDEERYRQSFHSCQEELLAGNSYELCLTVEAEIKLPPELSWPLYKKLRQSNPVPFAAYLQLGKTTVLSSSPEQFLSWNREGSIDMVPMKGTVKKSPDLTLAKASEILASPKESAENLMIADLIRHDLYRALGSLASVEVVKLCEVVEHETVYQLVSHIRANAPPEFEDLDILTKHSKVIDRGLTALQQTLPPGSMTGAPKKRSCEILGELEQRPRGVYSGVLGYLDVGGGGNFSVCIRTAFSNEQENDCGLQTWRVGAGGAITVLSDADAEWEEMRTKMESVLRAFRPG